MGRRLLSTITCVLDTTIPRDCCWSHTTLISSSSPTRAVEQSSFQQPKARWILCLRLPQSSCLPEELSKYFSWSIRKMLFGQTLNASREHRAEQLLQRKSLQRFAGKLESLDLVYLLSQHETLTQTWFTFGFEIVNLPDSMRHYAVAAFTDCADFPDLGNVSFNVP